MKKGHHFLYNLLIVLASPPLIFLSTLYLLLNPKHRRGLSQRLGFLPKAAKRQDGRKKIWIHAASVGEVSVAESIIQSISPDRDISLIVSTYTWEGLEYARKQLNGRACTVLYPLDLQPCVHRALKSVKPDIYVTVETELWPNFLLNAHRLGIRTILVNGRISTRSLERFILIKPFIKSVLDCLDLISMAGASHAQRIMALGAAKDRIRVCPNAKYGSLVDRVTKGRDKVEEFRNFLGISPDTHVLVAGSVRKGEGSSVTGLCRTLTQKYPQSICIVAPRHMKSVPEWETTLRRAGLAYQCWSSLKNEGKRRIDSTILVDTLGDLFYLYGLATVAFCGASLVAYGGQNIMEPAAWGVAPLYGPYMDDFLDAAEMLESHDASIRVRDGNELIEKTLWLISNPMKRIEFGRRAREVALKHSGAARETADLILELLSSNGEEHLGNASISTPYGLRKGC